MSLHEIARRLFKPRWADAAEYRQAWNAFARLSAERQAEVRQIGETFK